MASQFVELEKKRRSIYHLGRNINETPEEITNLIQDAVKFAPTSFNNQAVRAVILLGDSQDKVWDIIAKTVKEIVGVDNYEQNFAPKIHSFKAGYGTVLFYTDDDTIEATFKQADSFPRTSFEEWAEQGQGSAQHSVWTALAEKGVGASIHHYNNLLGAKIDDALAAAFEIPDSWQLSGEMVFGSIEKAAHDKTFIDDSQRFKVFK